MSGESIEVHDRGTRVRLIVLWCVGAALAVATVIVAVVGHLRPPPSIVFVTRHSHIELPAHLEDVDDEDNTGGLAAVHVRLEPADAQRLATRYAFHPTCSGRGLGGLGLLQPANRTLPPPDRLLCLEGSAHACVSWTYALEIATGRLWIGVHYPDWGGTPRCDDDPRLPL